MKERKRESNEQEWALYLLRNVHASGICRACFVSKTVSHFGHRRDNAMPLRTPASAPALLTSDWGSARVLIGQPSGTSAKTSHAEGSDRNNEAKSGSVRSCR